MEHGAFTPWLRSNFKWSERTAQNYISAAKFSDDKSETVSHLAETTIYRLLRADLCLRDAILGEIRAAQTDDDRLKDKEVRQRLHKLKQAGEPQTFNADAVEGVASSIETQPSASADLQDGMVSLAELAGQLVEHFRNVSDVDLLARNFDGGGPLLSRLQAELQRVMTTAGDAENQSAAASP
ncbi:hypothetical protein NGM99_00245 [Mesorhizobium sp. RP14(2022)]|uniref:Terminase small subunit n=2 Tax=Mesorhizobium liriopis TaxID=2953882 RepID=A0ABT1C153_9HYPH|nr:hypothetical protein [Mesorhizobium liriopis]